MQSYLLRLLKRHFSLPFASCSDESWSSGGESAGSVSRGWSSLDGGEFWESEISSKILSSLLSQDLVVLLNDGLDDVDRVSSGAVSSSHLSVHLGDGSAKSGGSVLFVHVDDTGSSKIFKDDSEVFHGGGFFLEDLADRDDFTLALSNLVLSLHLVPELGSCEHDILGEDSNSIASWLWSSFTWKLSSDNPILLDLNTKNLINNSFSTQ